jgi:hypothetical protein
MFTGEDVVVVYFTRHGEARGLLNEIRRLERTLENFRSHCPNLTELRYQLEKEDERE